MTQLKIVIDKIQSFMILLLTLLRRNASVAGLQMIPNQHSIVIVVNNNPTGILNII